MGSWFCDLTCWCCLTCTWHVWLVLCSLWFTDYLNQNADMFQRTATRLKRKLWWQNVKLWIILIVIILVIIIVVIGEWTSAAICATVPFGILVPPPPPWPLYPLLYSVLFSPGEFIIARCSKPHLTGLALHRSNFNFLSHLYRAWYRVFTVEALI